MPAGIKYENNVSRKPNSYATDVNQRNTDILRTVREQEAQFERLTRELESEREQVVHKLQQYRIGSETESMNSISSTDDTFQWGGAQDDSVRFGDESHGLMDSCLQELENRGTMQFGEDNMNYMPEDRYGGPGQSREYNSYNGGPHHDTSLHSSHVSLQSASSNRNRAQMKLSNQNLGSRTSIPQDQHNHDNYAPYSSLQRNYDDYRGSPIHSNGSPRSPGTPTRGAPDDRYGAPPVQPEDSFYRQSPMLDNRFGGGPPPNDPRDNYVDSPKGGYPGDDSFQGHPDNSFQGQPNYSSQPQLVDRYGHPIEEGYPAGMVPQEEVSNLDERYRDHMDDSYREPHEESYRGPQDDNNRGPQEDNYRGPQDESVRGPQDDSFRGPVPQDDRYQDFRDEPADRYDDQPINRSLQQDPHGNVYPNNIQRDYADDSYQQEPDRRHDGLPQVQDDPFADDPFRQKQRSLLQLQDEDPYPRGPSPGAGSDRMGPGSYTERPPQYDHMDGQEPPGRYFEEGVGPPMGSQQHIDGYPEDGRRTPSTTGGTMQWRQPDLQEVMDFLSHPNNMIKANAAGYITHLSYMDDNIKQKIRGLDGIPLLVDMLNNEYPEVHRNACSALKNLSYGKNNDDNKKAVKNAGGIPALVRLLRKTQDEDVKDAVTGVLWNLSSSDDLKKSVIDDGLTVLVNYIIKPLSGWQKQPYLATSSPQDIYTTVFRNATGVLRNVSSAGFEARKKLRECQDLVESLLHTLRSAIDQNNVDNKPVENCVCTLRNLSFRIQEVEDPDFFKKRQMTLKKQKQQSKGEKTGCFGGVGKKKGQKGKGGQNTDYIEMPKLPTSSNEYRGLWSVEAVRYFLTLLTGSNPATLEGACGAIQNLAACDWKPAIEIRALVRKEKGLPSLVDLLTYEVERVVGASATALRNLSIDERNKELVGKYAMKQLISNLPQENRPKELTDETVCAVLACLNEVIQHNQEFAKSFCSDGGLPRLMYLTRVHEIYNTRTKKYAASVCQSLWEVKVLHKVYMDQGYTERDFKPPLAISSGQPYSNFSTPYNTINRPKYSQGYDDTTLASQRDNGYTGSPAMMGSDPRLVQGVSNPALDQQDMYGSKQGRLDAVPLNDIGPGYAPIDEPTRQPRNKIPAGAVPLFPNMMPAEQTGSPTQEPLYARVNKKRPASPSQVVLGQDQGGQEGADSWV